MGGGKLLIEQVLCRKVINGFALLRLHVRLAFRDQGWMRDDFRWTISPVFFHSYDSMCFHSTNKPEVNRMPRGLIADLIIVIISECPASDARIHPRQAAAILLLYIDHICSAERV